MKKIIALLAVLAMTFSFASCSSEEVMSSVPENESAVETTEEKTTEKATEEKTEPPTEKKTEKASANNTELSKTFEIGDLKLLIPESSIESTEDVAEGKMSLITFDDSSMIQIIGFDLSAEYDLSDLSNDELDLVLNTYAEAFVTADGWEAKNNLEPITIKNVAALKQEALNSSVVETTLYHFIYGEFVYSVAFCGMSFADASTAYDMQQDIIDTFEFGEISSSNSSDENKAPNNSSVDGNTTLGQRNALESAKTYIDIMAFSYDGLIEQLEYEQYSHEEAVYGADNCGANWNNEALESAENYVDIMDFSYSGLIDQLVYEGFTSDQASYGADNCGADWNAEAAEAAEGYLNTFSFSRAELIDQLLYEGFTQAQAEYGAQSVGY